MDDLKTESEETVKQRIKNRFDGLALLRNVLGDKNIDYEMCGGYEIFDQKQKFDKASEFIGILNKWLEEITWENNVYSVTETNGYRAIKNRLEGALHSGKMMYHLYKKVRDRGVEFHWNQTVREIHSHKVVLNDEITLETQNILLATNGFTRLIRPDIPVKPARGYVFVTNELKDLRWNGTFHYDAGYVYFRNIGKRILLGGARNIDIKTEETTAFSVNPKIKTWLIDFGNHTLKLEPNWKIDYEWTGIMGFAETKNPMVQKLDDHLFVACGLGGMGVAIGMEIGRYASYMLEEG